ncbi:(deoxy)nucleoside triphosphate pyrophosphohydrolase [Erythrobacter sp.]|uniref:(deoxy)nucleoside triphosphate pyrophosphohydrolase n=1 Tax=Erythrobacter sp. TaxID=1042 RepID=UPI001B14CB61|nr:(deoxy)nucleoside triphosphate pyrophosphohydrolase [Erythrobacter sp.]MBO6526904.1 (deoxy)nucleoside triphosphate pyrophosphohydrolase [Erythrobacter sp.]MBO6528576.1 (deoxy)nucleoside triphosphate pyrophosphohydrolase [Erythrobacter sp.]
MENFPTWTCVVAAALFDEKGRWLMHRRPSHKHHGGLWEFPGGKVESGENPRNALVREIQEELGIALEIDALTPVAFAEESPNESPRPIVIMLYKSLWSGPMPQALEGGEVAWLTPEEVTQLAKPPLDVELASRMLEKA